MIGKKPGFFGFVENGARYYSLPGVRLPILFFLFLGVLGSGAVFQ
jgi:hypothetical protein